MHNSLTENASETSENNQALSNVKRLIDSTTFSASRSHSPGADSSDSGNVEDNPGTQPSTAQKPIATIKELKEAFDHSKLSNILKQELLFQTTALAYNHQKIQKLLSKYRPVLVQGLMAGPHIKVNSEEFELIKDSLSLTQNILARLNDATTKSVGLIVNALIAQYEQVLGNKIYVLNEVIKCTQKLLKQMNSVAKHNSETLRFANTLKSINPKSIQLSTANTLNSNEDIKLDDITLKYQNGSTSLSLNLKDYLCKTVDVAKNYAALQKQARTGMKTFNEIIHAEDADQTFNLDETGSVKGLNLRPNITS